MCQLVKLIFRPQLPSINGSKDFWQKTRVWASNSLDTNIQLTICEIIFGITITGNSSINTINFLILIGKLFINISRWFACTQEKITCLNFEERLKNMETTINIWNSRNLSLKGKTIIINTLIVSQVQFLNLRFNLSWFT